jgi:hypothetical protein
MRFGFRFFTVFLSDIEQWTVELAEAASTKVDPADMREFIGSEDLTYRPDHGSSRGASSL